MPTVFILSVAITNRSTDIRNPLHKSLLTEYRGAAACPMIIRLYTKLGRQGYAVHYHHEIFSIGPQWANRYEVTLKPTPPHLPTFVMTYHDLATQFNQTFIYQPNLDGSPQNFQHRPTVGKQI